MAILFPDSAELLSASKLFPRSLGSYDADALLAFAAVEGTGATLTSMEKAAANSYIVALKDQALWDKIVALYLFIGGTADAHAVNWKNPGVYDTVWSNSPTHSAIGVLFEGTSFGDTQVSSVNAEVLGLFGYVNGYNTVDTAFPIVAAQDGYQSLDAILSFGSDNLLQTMIGSQSARSGDAMPSRTTGFVFGGRSDDTTIIQRVGSSSYSYSTASATNLTPSGSLYIGACNTPDGPTFSGSGGRLAMAGVSATAFDATDMVALDTATTTLQTALSRA